MLRVYAYRLYPPTQQAERIEEQLTLAHRYRNKLIELERKRRLEVRTVQATHADVAEWTAKILALKDELSKLHPPARRKAKAKAKGEETVVEHAAEVVLAAAALGLTPEELSGASAVPAPAAAAAAAAAAEVLAAMSASERAERVTAVRVDLRTATIQAKEARARARADTTIATRLAAIEEADKDARKEARAACGVYWGTYLLVEAAMDAQRKAISDPKFIRWRGAFGILGAQLQKGLAVSEAFGGTDGRLRIVMPREGAWDHPTRGERRRRCRTRVHMRIGSNESRAPIWGEWPLTMHQPLPKDGQIKWAKVIARPFCLRTHWFLQLTVEVPDRAAPGVESPKADAIGIDLGWRKFDDNGIRVAYGVGSDGQHHELRLSPNVQWRLDKAASIHGFRDKAMDEMRADILPMVRLLREATIPLLSEVLIDRLAALHAWRSPSRFIELQLALEALGAEQAVLAAGARHPQVETLTAIVGRLDQWRKRNLHLWQYESGLRRKALGHRLEQFRIFALQIAQQYQTVVVEKWDLHKYSQRENPNAPQGVARGQRTIAAVGLFRTTLQHTAGRLGRKVVFTEAVNTTRTCYVCGFVDVGGVFLERVHQCPDCLAEWDQDSNAAHNILRAAEPEVLTAAEAQAQAVAAAMQPTETPATDASDETPTGAAAVAAAPKGRWAKRKAVKAAKTAETESAKTVQAET